MRAVQNALIGAGLAGLALAHAPRGFQKRATLPYDGVIYYGCTKPGTVALTFDDGPHIYTQSIVDKLTAAGHRATFFQNGLNYGSIYDYASTVQSMIAGGHQVASHTWAHADLATLDAAGITEQMGLLEAAHLSIIGKAPTYMRPPYLSLSELAISTLKDLKYIIVEVDVDTLDYTYGPLGQIQTSIGWFEGNVTAGGSMVLNHDPYEATATTFVPAAIAWLDSKGLKSVPAGECLGDDPANWYRGGSVSVSSAIPSSTPAPSSVPSSIPAGNGTVPTKPSGSAGPGKPGSPSGPSYPYPTPTGSHGGYSGKPCGGGDTEPGHGENAGRGALPGHKGEGNHGWTGYTKPGNGSTSGHASTTGAIAPSPSYYVNAASGLTGSAVVIGAAAMALLL